MSIQEEVVDGRSLSVFCGHEKVTVPKELSALTRFGDWNKKLKMLVEQNTTATSLTPASTPTGTHPTDLSPRSSSSGSGSNSSTPTPIKEEHTENNFSALQKLQYAFERDAYFSNLINNNEHQSSIHGKTNISILSPSRLHERNPSPEESLERIEMNGRHKFVSTPTASPNGISNPANIFQCPLCAVVCNSRHQFNEHLVTHSKQHACPKCSFITSGEEKLKSHLQEAHDVNDSEFLTDDEIRVPKINSQGKVKTFKCKQCDYKSVTKMEFWAHSKSHIRQEKMLTCPHCPFVTEYKHHLEYHLRNHVGSKPFQCTKCSYTCVNKSMLNSHLKSHSNVYQYRCADCSYATKYCHSLKLHLRKYSHNPSVVLNPDGTPNPLPIIDVYGTRRGPKMKRSDQTTPNNNNNEIQNFKFSSPDCNSDDSSAEDHSDKTDKNGYNNNCSSVSPVSPEISLLGLKRESGCNTPPFKTFSSEASDSDSEKRMGRSYQHKIQVPESPLTPNSLKGLHQNHLSAPLMELASQSSIEAYTAALNQFLFSPLLRIQQQQQQPISDMTKIAEDQHAKLLSQFLQSQSIVPLAKQSPILHHSHHQHNIFNNHISSNKLDTPLDLRNPKVAMEDDSGERGRDDCKKRKPRKGKALRYDRKAESYEEDDDDSYRVLDFSNNNNNNILVKMETETGGNNVHNVNGYGHFQEQQSLMTCKYCEISFTHRVLYNMHMNYHSGDSNPFLCKSCGKKTPDKIAFSIHLTTDSH